jgi:hypothetical protein
MSTPPPQQPPSEEELRAAYEQQIKQLRVEDVVVQTLVSLVNLGGRKAGLAQGSEDERDPAQLQMAIDAATVLLPLVEGALGPDGAQVRNAISQLQMAYAQITGTEPQQGAPQPPPQQPQQPPQSPGGGRLWVPGQ